MEVIMNLEQGYRATRQAWIDGVNQFYPGAPKESYVLPWERMPEWEKEAVKKLYDSIRMIILPGLKKGVRLPNVVGGYLVASIWNALMYELLGSPKPSYVIPFDQLSSWQQKTDYRMFEAIEASVLQEIQQQELVG
jgi:hypothetical protein